MRFIIDGLKFTYTLETAEDTESSPVLLTIGDKPHQIPCGLTIAEARKLAQDLYVIADMAEGGNRGVTLIESFEVSPEKFPPYPVDGKPGDPPHNPVQR
jgi:hypothetical protein